MKLNLFGPIAHTGMGIHFQNFARHVINMAPKDWKIFVGPRGPVGFMSDGHAQIIGPHLDVGLFDPAGLSLSITSPSQTYDFAGSPRYVHVVFETDQLSDQDRKGLCTTDRVYVPSKWHQEIIQQQVPRAASEDFVRILHEGVDLNVFRPGNSYRDPHTLKLISVAKWEKRKGQRILLDALIACEIVKPIILLAFWVNPFLPDQSQMFEALRVRGFKPTGPASFRHQTKDIEIQVKNWSTVPPHEMAETIRGCDWGVYPSFGEGWGLPILETLACGVPVMTPYYSGPTEYLPAPEKLNSTCYINLTGQKVTASDGVFFHGDRGKWLAVSAASVTDALNQAGKMLADEWSRRSVAASAQASGFSWQRCAEDFIRSL